MKQIKVQGQTDKHLKKTRNYQKSSTFLLKIIFRTKVSPGTADQQIYRLQGHVAHLSWCWTVIVLYMI